MSRLTHICAATLLAASIAVPVAGLTAPKPAPAAAPKACMSKDDVSKRVKGAKPRFDLTGSELEAFNANYKIFTKQSPAPGVDEIMVWGEGDEDQNLLFVVFSKGCVAGAAFVPAKDFLKVLYGNRA